MSAELPVQLTALGALMAEAQTIAAPYDAQIRTLEIAKADALAHLTFQIETLKSVLRPVILAAGQTVIADGIRATYVQKHTWDTDTLQEMAKEIPAILQCLREAPYVTFRVTRS